MKTVLLTVFLLFGVSLSANTETCFRSVSNYLNKKSNAHSEVAALACSGGNDAKKAWLCMKTLMNLMPDKSLTSYRLAAQACSRGSEPENAEHCVRNVGYEINFAEVDVLSISTMVCSGNNTAEQANVCMLTMNASQSPTISNELERNYISAGACSGPGNPKVQN